MIIPQNPEQLLQLFNSPWFLILLIWSMFWKGIALWTASQRKQKIWFVGRIASHKNPPKRQVVASG